MRKIVQIYSRKFLGDYCYAQSSKRIPDQVLFVAGVIMTVVVPQITFAAYGRITPFITLAFSAAIGSVLGWIMSKREPDQVISCVSSRNVPQAPSSEKAARDKAA